LKLFVVMCYTRSFNPVTHDNIFVVLAKQASCKLAPQIEYEICSIGGWHAVAHWLRHYAASRKVVGSRPDEGNEFFFQIIPASLGPGIYSTSDRNEYHKEKNNNPAGAEG
jgi:hypothetical protein